MRILVLGGTRFVGRAIVAEALLRGHDVTVLSRGESGTPAAGTRWQQADRRDGDALRSLAATEWDAVMDTWDGDAGIVASSADLLAGSAHWYGYVSSRSVYRWPMPLGADETAPVVDVEPGGGYPAAKRGAEIAVADRFAGRCLLARAGLIVGPYEDTGRLTWWLQRASVGGWMIAPEPADMVWQLLDARDLATFMLDAAAGGVTGAYNVVCPRSDAVTTRRIVAGCVGVTGGRATPAWIPPAVLRRAGIAAWDDLPGWVPPGDEAAGMHDCDVAAAVAAGLRCRPVEATISDTWDWMQTLPPRSRRPIRAGLPRRGLSAEQEQAILWLAAPGRTST